MRQSASELPALFDDPGASLRAASWGGLTCAYIAFGKGTDMTPLLKGLPDDRCPVPHWGYILSGAMRVEHTDGQREVIRPGELFYLPPGHTVIFEEDTAYVEFSPEREQRELLDHVASVMQG